MLGQAVEVSTVANGDKDRCDTSVGGRLEILSLHAEEVELNMLGQVRAATTGQLLTVHVGRGGNTVVRFRVDSTTPSTAQSEAVEPDTDEAAEPAAIAVRLSTDTEVIIAPRLRKKVVDPAMEEEHSLQPTNKPSPMV